MMDRSKQIHYWRNGIFLHIWSNDIFNLHIKIRLSLGMPKLLELVKLLSCLCHIHTYTHVHTHTLGTG